jgi:alanyl-tRNA synthetase
VDEERVEEVTEGRFQLVTDRTPFYAESGGQIGDAGNFVSPAGSGTVRDTQAVEGVYAMFAEMESGRIAVGDTVELIVDEERRDAIRRNHTATHLLHRALRNHLGEGAVQAGSLVAPDRLRFDFHHEGGLSEVEIEAIEEEVNREILANTGLATDEMAIADAKASGAVSLFGEKYGDRVRVVTVGDYSKELCGGTHCAATGDIGSLRIVSESNIGSGMRRIEAVTGEGAVRLVHRDRRILRDLSTALKSPAEEIPDRVAALRAQVRDLEKRLDEALTIGGGSGAAEDRETLENGVTVVVRRYPDSYEMKHLLAAADEVRGERGATAALIAAVGDGGVTLVVAATPGLVEAGFDAGAAVRDVAGLLGGNGGGRPDLGRGKGTDPSRFDEGALRLKELAGALSPLS